MQLCIRLVSVWRALLLIVLCLRFQLELDERSIPLPYLNVLLSHGLLDHLAVKPNAPPRRHLVLFILEQDLDCPRFVFGARDGL